MTDWFGWFTRMENSKVLALLLFFVTFCGILLYLFTGRKRGARLESYKYIPFQDEEAQDESGHSEVEKNEQRDR